MSSSRAKGFKTPLVARELRLADWNQPQMFTEERERRSWLVPICRYSQGAVEDIKTTCIALLGLNEFILACN